jgi:hypothetical protein
MILFPKRRFTSCSILNSLRPSEIFPVFYWALEFTNLIFGKKETGLPSHDYQGTSNDKPASIALLKTFF